MKLYLSSVGIPDKQAYEALFDGQRGTIGVIANAWMVAPPEKSLPFIDATIGALQQMGFTIKKLDLLEYKGKEDELQKVLATLQGVWVTGGNTFYLNWCVRQSGFDAVIGAACKAGLVYGGESAGAVIAGTTLHGIENLDDPHEPKEPIEIIWEGMNLVDYGIIPHWDEPKYGQRLHATRDEMAKATTVKTLRNGEVVVIDTN